jgi:hypothetical protein
MKDQGTKDGENFEQRLLAQLKHEVAERSALEQAPPVEVTSPARVGWRPPRLAIGAGAALASAAAVFAISAGGGSGSQAFAVESQDNGGVTISVYSAEDASGLEGALADAGIRSDVTWLPAGMECREPRFEMSSVKNAIGGSIGGLHVAGPGSAMTIGIMTRDQYRDLKSRYKSGELTEDEFYGATGNITLDPTQFGPDQSVVISGAPGPSADVDAVVNGPTEGEPLEIDPEGGYEASFGVAEGPVAACEPEKVADGGMLGAMNRVLEAEAAGQAKK